MSTEDIQVLVDKIDGLAVRVGTLESAVTTLMTRTDRNEKVLHWLRMAGLLLLGAALGSGVVKLDDVLALVGAP